MAENSLTLNGDSSDVQDTQTGGTSVNMVAALQDHIHCARPASEEVSPQNSRNNRAEIYQAPEFDHMYANFNDDTQGVMIDDCEHVRQLKDMLLVYLDFIQQQADELQVKDRRIVQLREENDMLRLRLERRDRRDANREQRDREVSFDHLPSTSRTVAPPVEPSTSAMPPDFSEFSHCVATLSTTQADSMPIVVHAGGEERSTTSVHTVANDFTTMESVNSTPLYQYTKRRRRDIDCASPITASYLRSRKAPVSWTCTSNQSATDHEDSRQLSENERPSSRATPNRRSEGRPRGKRGRRRGRFARRDVETIKQEFEPPEEFKPIKEEIKVEELITDSSIRDPRIAATNDLYYTNIGDSDNWMYSTDDYINTLTQEGVEVPCPTWRLRFTASGYSMEGTENLGDDVFEKRHQRPEALEKKRKRWDVQRLRELRQNERLQRRQRISMQRRRGTSSLRDYEERLTSLWPPPINIYSVDIQETVPISVFGGVILESENREFSVRGTGTHRTYTRRKRNRQSNKE